MKSIIITFIIAISLLFANEMSAQIFVRVRPIAPLIVRPAIPSPRHVWIEGEWDWDRRRGEYVYRQGYWMEPRPSREWVPEFWEDGRDGSRWVGGH